MKTALEHLLIAIASGAILFFHACRQKEAVQPLFEKLSSRETGVSFANTLAEEPLFNSINYLYFHDGGGVAAGDINNDGLTDVYFTANQLPNRLYLNKKNFQFEDITGKAGVGGEAGGWTTGATMADVNGDGFLDIYVCRSNYLDKKGANLLFINNKDLTFTERAAEYGLAVTALSRQAAFFDYDRDGDLDMFLLTHSVHAKKTYGAAGRLRQIRDAEAGDKLFKNENGRFLEVTAQAGISESILGYGLGVAIGDFNGDGHPDIYVANDFHEDDYLYYNNGNGTFTEALRHSMAHTSSAAMGVDAADCNNDGWLDIVVLDMLPEQEEIRKSSVSADPFDIYDAKLSFGYYHQLRRNTLQLNRGPVLDRDSSAHAVPHLFSEIGQLAGVHATDWSWAPLFADFDNDGNKDLFVTNGIFRRPNDLDYLDYLKQPATQAKIGRQDPTAPPVPIARENLHEIVAHMPSVPQANYAFHANGDLTFSNRAAAWGLGDPGFSSGAAYADFDNDGAVDLAVNNVNAPAAIYRNMLYQRTGNQMPNAKTEHVNANYLKLKLKGRSPNTFGVGAKVILRHHGKIFYQELMPTRGFQSAVEPVLHFGLGNIPRLDSLQVIWPTGECQTVRHAPINQTITLDQRDARAPHSQLSGNLPGAEQDSYRTTGAQNAAGYQHSPPLLQDITTKVRLDYSHQENTFIEYNREPFIPHFLSTEGPALAAADVNGDGREDLYLGGGKHQPGRMFLQNRSGGFDAVNDSIFIKDALCEDVDAIFFDANGDNLSDLYVVSGGNEFFERAEPLRDRLYLNDGNGRFRKATEALPEIYANGSCARPADFDNDGDLDLFVGSRSVPWQYGAIPPSYLLLNDGRGHFLAAPASLLPDSSRLGMVTDAVWADLNKDGHEDLIVVGEWMPITVFHNKGGRFAEATAQYGLQNTAGWWNTVAAADVNQDGFTDLVAGNLGLNSLLKASPEKPVQLFINDFSGDGKAEQILTYFNGGKAYPLASSELMFAHIPSLRARYRKHADYAGAAVEDIFPRQQLQAATVRAATEFSSLLLLNQGNQTFGMQRLPMEAQFSPIYAILSADFNRDGHPDLLVGGNFHGAPPDQGRYDAGYGSLLLGDGTGAFAPASLQRSGFVVAGEMRALRTVQTASGETLVLAARNHDTVLIFKTLITGSLSGRHSQK